MPELKNRSYLTNCVSYSEIIDGRAYEHKRTVQHNTTLIINDEIISSLHTGTGDNESINALDEGIKIEMVKNGKSMNNALKED